jgi:hypothetical protein
MNIPVFHRHIMQRRRSRLESGGGGKVDPNIGGKLEVKTNEKWGQSFKTDREKSRRMNRGLGKGQVFPCSKVGRGKPMF